jgi:5-formyltetrahydrofolate cyclo-ligase
MGQTIQNAKEALRRQVREKVATLGERERANASIQACALLKGQEHWIRAQSIMFYAPLANELDVWPLLTEALSMGKAVALPRFFREQGVYGACQIRELSLDIRPGEFAIREPASHCAALEPSALDLVLVPGVAFDRHGRRLGRGKGFYDRLLVLIKGATCGVSFDEQVVDEIPVEPHDVRLNCILTPTRWIDL